MNWNHAIVDIARLVPQWPTIPSISQRFLASGCINEIDDWKADPSDIAKLERALQSFRRMQKDEAHELVVFEFLIQVLLVEKKKKTPSSYKGMNV